MLWILRSFWVVESVCDMQVIIWCPGDILTLIYLSLSQTAILLLRIDDIVSGLKKRGDGGAGGGAPEGGPEQ